MNVKILTLVIVLLVSLLCSASAEFAPLLRHDVDTDRGETLERPGTGGVAMASVPWPPRSMAGSSERPPRREKLCNKTLRGAVRPTDRPAGRGDAHGHVSPTRGPCRSRARHCFERPPKGPDFYALPLPWGALQRRAYVCPRLKSDVHSTCWFFKQLCPQKKYKKSGQAAHPQL